MDPLSRLRDDPDDDSLTDVEHTAVLAAAERLDELRPAGSVCSLDAGGALTVRPPAGVDKDVEDARSHLGPRCARGPR